MPDLTDSEIRAVAVEAAGRVTAEGSPTGHVLSTARMLGGYIRSGLSQVGPRFRQGLVLGQTGVLLRVDGEGITPALAERLSAAVTDILTEERK